MMVHHQKIFEAWLFKKKKEEEEEEEEEERKKWKAVQEIVRTEFH